MYTNIYYGAFKRQQRQIIALQCDAATRDLVVIYNNEFKEKQRKERSRGRRQLKSRWYCMKSLRLTYFFLLFIIIILFCSSLYSFIISTTPPFLEISCSYVNCLTFFKLPEQLQIFPCLYVWLKHECNEWNTKQSLCMHADNRMVADKSEVENDEGKA